jgi:hypothetical protein
MVDIYNFKDHLQNSKYIYHGKEQRFKVNNMGTAVFLFS